MNHFKLKNSVKVAIIVGLFAFVSCKKDRTCTCTTTNNGSGNATVNVYTVKSVTKKAALGGVCASYTGTSGNNVEMVSCTLN